MVDAFLLAAAAACALLLAASAFFSSSEIAVFSLQLHRVQSLAESGDSRARALAALREDPHRLLVTILVGNNVVNVALSTVIAALAIAVFPDGTGIAVATVVTSVVVLLFGEIAPKAFGVANAESWSLRVARPVTLLERALGPLVYVFERASGVITSLVGGADVPKPYVTREEIRALLQTGAQLGVIDRDERAMVQAVLDLEQEAVEELMTPIEDAPVVPATATPADARDTLLAADTDVALVRGDTLDDVRGTVTVYDASDAADAGTDLADATRPALTARESWTAHDLLQAFREESETAAVVTDHTRETVGLATRDHLDDLVLWRGR